MNKSKIHKHVLLLLKLTLISSCAEVDPYVFDVDSCEFVNATDHRIHCTDPQADGRVSVTPKEALKISEKLDNCKN